MIIPTLTRALRTPATRLGFNAALNRNFHSSLPRFIKIGDPLPNLDCLQEGSPGNKVNLAEEASKLTKMIILGVPAAFSPSCSSTHVPGFIKHPKTQEFDQVAVVSVNDVFVMKAWGGELDPGADFGIRFLADPEGKFTKAMDMGFVNESIFGGLRSKRYSIIVEDGKVKSINVEPDSTGTSVSLAEHVLGPE
ncbi:Redoxin-domain-containing protein [Podospora fimiseda]|uniref:Redoxin-domain-containing protein n=1 Tax=Podospora fimiseda TaxID=252190 RepID=A0AAN7H845_9PEZI|nr:Redoxin-domain-containing protein [Podospora fimiseda]